MPEAFEHRLRVRFFGPFEASYGGAGLALRSGRARSLFKYLLAHGGGPVSRERLMDWLWPDSGLKRAAWSLNSAVYALRRGLDARSPGLGGCVVARAGYYRLHPALEVSSDAEEFDRRRDEGRRLARVGHREAAAGELERAAGLYRGEYLAEDLYEDWTMIERERLAAAHVETLEHLAGLYLETGQPGKSIQRSYLILKNDPSHEEAYRLLMLGHARLGQRARAITHYELCERALGSRYGLSPSPETRDLRRRLLDGGAV